MNKFKDNEKPYILIALENDCKTTETTLRGTQNEVLTLFTILTKDISKEYDISLPSLFLLIHEALSVLDEE